MELTRDAIEFHSATGHSATGHAARRAGAAS